MYYPNWIEDVCYEDDHIDQVKQALQIGFFDYYCQFLDTRGGISITDDEFRSLAEHFNSHSTIKKTASRTDEVIPALLDKVTSDFEADREKYLDLFDEDYLDEYSVDPSAFKNTELRNRCPIIRHTLNNTRIKQLDRYRKSFKEANAAELLSVVGRVAAFAREYRESIYQPDKFENTRRPDDLLMSALGEEDCTYFGVIGGGIRSHFLYKYFPDAFPNRSQDAIWALWYLSAKKSFGCKQDSEFLMIDTKKCTTQQNYFYPYDLFVLYALEIWRMLAKEAASSNVRLEKEYRFVIVDAFVSFIARCHETEIADLKAQVADYEST